VLGFVEAFIKEFSNLSGENHCSELEGLSLEMLALLDSSSSPSPSSYLSSILSHEPLWLDRIHTFNFNDSLFLMSRPLCLPSPLADNAQSLLLNQI